MPIFLFSVFKFLLFSDYSFRFYLHLGLYFGISLMGWGLDWDYSWHWHYGLGRLIVLSWQINDFVNFYIFNAF
jgi:hypothetical protein